MAAAKAAWGEAARSDPEKLNIDEFLTFTHPEFSHPLIIQDSEATLGLLDADADDVLSEDEYTKMASNKVSARRTGQVSCNLLVVAGEWRPLLYRAT